MGSLNAFVRKEFHHILRDRWTLLILLVTPIIMLVLIGFAMTTEVKGTTFMVIDPSRDSSTREIIESLSKSDYFSFGGYLPDDGRVDGAFRTGEAGLILVFPAGFDSLKAREEGAGILLITDSSDPNTARTLTQYASAIIMRVARESAGALGNSGPLKNSGQVSVETRLLYNPAMKGAYNFVPGVLGMILLLICAMMTSISIAREKESGTMEILLASPMRPTAIIFAKTVPYFVISCMNLITSLLLSMFVLGVPVRGSWAALIIVSFLYILVGLLIGIMISTIAESQIVALLISGMGMMLPVMLLSGMMFPTESMPFILRLFSNIIPTRWYISAMRKIMIKGLGLGSITRELAILTLMAAVVLFISLRKFKPRLE